ncbi:hypothetical protein WA026_009762 [Henosepilachna vigintioctopunctata]|uniref:Peroxisomal membrane protein PEX16 n=1 Tax=Henosepilachna vigintioctopunctata TaxID=420089 RepID=A0AAW1TL84_9CUCU
MSVNFDISKLYNKYKHWVNKNPVITTDYETTAKWISYFVAGKINSSYVASELVYCLSNLLVLHNDRIMCNLRHLKNTNKSGELLKLYLTVIEYSEVFIELSAEKLWGEKGRWAVICTIQIIKCICKLLLVYVYKEPIIQSPVIPVLERHKLDKNNVIKYSKVPIQHSLSSDSFKLKHSGRIMRKIDLSPPINFRSWKSVYQPSTSDIESEETVEQALVERALAAETVYILKPLVHLGSIYYYGNDNWKSYILALMFDLCSLQLYRTCDNMKSNSLTNKQRFQINKRTANLLFYLLRSPFYNKYSKEKVIKLLNAVNHSVPLASFICAPLLQYLSFWQNNYFYMWSA